MSKESSVHVETAMNLPSREEDSKLASVLLSTLKKRRTLPEATVGPFWPASFFGLDRCSVYLNASKSEQDDILLCCSASVLEEAYFIEKAGMAFAAKMVLLSKTVEERMLYSLFASDEATHFELIRRFVNEAAVDCEPNPFLALLSGFIESGQPLALQFVVQIVLEGWGLAYYRDLAKGCTDEPLRTVFDAILRDEASHHGSGLVLFSEEERSESVSKQIIEVMIKFLGMVQLGPQAVCASIERVVGPFTGEKRIKIFQELNASTHSAQRLELLRNLMLKSGAEDIVEALEQEGCFVACSPQECAQ